MPLHAGLRFVAWLPAPRLLTTSTNVLHINFCNITPLPQPHLPNAPDTASRTTSDKCLSLWCGWRHALSMDMAALHTLARYALPGGMPSLYVPASPTRARMANTCLASMPATGPVEAGLHGIHGCCLLLAMPSPARGPAPTAPPGAHASVCVRLLLATQSPYCSFFLQTSLVSLG